jgi:predicted ATPase
MVVYLKDLLDLLAAVNKGDFVLKLAEGVEKSEETLRSYVVTPQLERCFDEVLSLIQNALSGSSSKACYLHGSFGSGKSHFMAVLHLILAGNTRARSIPELHM